jgi:hypothetical protein
MTDLLDPNGQMDSARKLEHPMPLFIYQIEMNEKKKALLDAGGWILICCVH